MSDIMTTKAFVDNKKINFSIPISKVDEERRMVHGWATLDNVDLQGDVVPVEASIRAFENFRGNIREMHDPLKAVGKMVSFRPEKYYDPESGKLYRGIFVSAYVSKGAPDTWEKILDKTLTGFSIGGSVEKASDAIDDGELHRIIEEYSLTELSLVDNPANQYANVISIEKSEDSGYLSQTKAENVFWCKRDNTVQITSSPSATCYHCDVAMQNIGFVETNDVEKMSVIKSLLEKAKNIPSVNDMVDFESGMGQIESIITNGIVKFKNSDEQLSATENDPVAIISVFTKNNDTMVATNCRTLKNISSLTKSIEKEVENMESPVEDVTVVDEVIEKSEEAVTEESTIEEVVAGVQENTDEVVEETEEVEKSVQTEEDGISKQISEIQEVLKSLTETLSPMVELIKSLGITVKENSDAVASLSNDVATAKSEIDALKSESEGFGKRVDAVESTTAFRKSADLGEIVQEQPQAASKWGGRILDTAFYN